MRLSPTNSSKRSRGAFSLIEVTLALAIVSIGLIAILGLLPKGIEASRSAADTTLAATIVQDAFNNLRTSTFTNAPTCDLCPFHDLSTYNQTDSNVYDQAGFTTNFANAYYKVMLRYEPQAPLFLTHVTATVVWPSLSPNPPNTNVFFTEVTGYYQ